MATSKFNETISFMNYKIVSNTVGIVSKDSGIITIERTDKGEATCVIFFNVTEQSIYGFLMPQKLIRTEKDLDALKERYELLQSHLKRLAELSKYKIIMEELL